MPISEAGRLVGYRDRHCSWLATKSRAYRLRAAKLAAQRQGLQAIPGLTLTDAVLHYGDLSRKLKSKDPSNSIRAQSRIDSLLGYDAPAQVQVQSVGLMMELSGLDRDDLQALLHEFSGERVGDTVGDEAGVCVSH